jgi:hypothetical protein
VNQQRMRVYDAAHRLGISEDAVRMRVKRGTLDAQREGGRLYVVLEGEPTPEPADRTDELLNELRDRVRSLEEANRENRRIIAALTARIPAIEAPPDATEAPETATAQPGRVGPQTEVEGPQTDAERRSWWREFFGFD